MNNSNNSNKENDFSLDNYDNYYKKINYDVSEILDKYINLTNEFLKFILEKTKTTNNNYDKFIIIRAYETVTNVFNNIFYYTKNLDLTFYHCQKSYYYYIEFIEQISQDQHVFLQLSSRDATTYVYKKTIVDLNHDLKKNMEPCSNEIKKIMQVIDEEIKLFKVIFEFLIENLYLNNSLNVNEIIIDKYKNICKKINISKLDVESITIFYKIIENINKKFASTYNDNDNSYLLLDKYFDLLLKILKKCSQKGHPIEVWKTIQNKAYNNELLF